MANRKQKCEDGVGDVAERLYELAEATAHVAEQLREAAEAAKRQEEVDQHPAVTRVGRLMDAAYGRKT